MIWAFKPVQAAIINSKSNIFFILVFMNE